jgi:hypothetical protein
LLDIATGATAGMAEASCACCAIHAAAGCCAFRSPEEGTELSVDVTNSRTAMMQSAVPSIGHLQIISRNRIFIGRLPRTATSRITTKSFIRALFRGFDIS